MEASLKSCAMARDFWRSQLGTGQEWIVFLVLIGDEDSKNSLSLNLDSSLKFRECCHSSLLYCCDLQLVFHCLHMKSKAQGHWHTDTSLEGWESNTCLRTPCHCHFHCTTHFHPQIKEKEAQILCEIHNGKLSYREACCSGKNSRPSDRPFLPLATLGDL